ncbi:MAG: ABC transporter substrate-binding protein [Chloroflexota bacterium]
MRVLAIWGLVLLLCLQGIVIAQDNNAEVTETPDPPITLAIWWPDSIARINDSDIHPALLLQADAFAAQHANLTFDHRLKPTGGQTGSIMSTLRSASNAAQGALPTLTLIRRQDLLTARANGYLRSLEGFPSSVQLDLNNALSLGQIEDELYGIPYFLELQHVVYRPQENVNYEDWSFDGVLERGQGIIFPAGRTSSLNDVVALQYVSVSDENTSDAVMTFDEGAVSDIFTYYQATVDIGLLSGEILNFNTVTGYFPNFVAGDIDSAVMTSTQYLTLLNEQPNDDDEDSVIAIAPIPTASGDISTFLSGWMWVMIAENPREQEIAIDYIEYLLAPERHAEVAQELGLLPSRERSITQNLSNPEDVAFYLELIENGILPLTDSNIGVVGRTIQTQFATILTLEQTAEDGLQAVIDAVGG